MIIFLDILLLPYANIELKLKRPLASDHKAALQQ